MPVNIMIGMLALLVALVLYTVATWMAFRRKSLTKVAVGLILTGVVFDVLATAMMAIQARGLVNDLHTYLAFIALGGMALAGIVGAWAIAQDKQPLLASVARLVPLPWVLWVAVFVWGMVTRGASRLG